MDKPYVFEGPEAAKRWPICSAGRSQLVVYHFMLGPDWEDGCKSCSFWADNFNGIDVHLAHRDVTLLAISSAPFDKINAYKQRMGWSFKWVSSAGCDFNHDYHVTFAPDEMREGRCLLQLCAGRSPRITERPGISVFYKSTGRHDLPHLFHLCARPRHDEWRVSLPRSGAEGPRRSRVAIPYGMGALARQIRGLTAAMTYRDTTEKLAAWRGQIAELRQKLRDAQACGGTGASA